MKIQGLAVISIVIILPMAILLSNYSASQIKTLDFQISYDNKLTTATYDGIKAYQLNMENVVTTSSEADSKIRNINAAIQTFYDSVANHFQMSGYDKDTINRYIPAVVFTLYDGYYIYSVYNNRLSDNDEFYYEEDAFKNSEAYEDIEYKNNTRLYGLKPYIYYSCRYVHSDIDVVITYSLDSFITIQGMIGNDHVNASGYLFTDVGANGETYRGIPIVAQENIQQYVYVNGNTTRFSCRKVNGRNYYLDNSAYHTNEQSDIFLITINNGNIEKQYVYPRITSPSNFADGSRISGNNSARLFYKAASDFKQRFGGSGDLRRLREITYGDARNLDGTISLYDDPNNGFSGDRNTRIFDELFDNSGAYIEDENSNFSQHKRDVIKYSIESNLRVAISAFNDEVSIAGFEFDMPRLTEVDWDIITNNVSMISFLQGLSIGGKIYNGYSVVPNNLNENYVSENSIYLADTNNYYDITDNSILSMPIDSMIGYLNTDFERKTVEESLGAGASRKKYYYPLIQMGSYTSIIERNNLNDHLNDILKQGGNSYSTLSNNNERRILSKYLTALGRERYGMSRSNYPFQEARELLTHH